jgi:hypothetical protein
MDCHSSLKGVVDAAAFQPRGVVGITMHVEVNRVPAWTMQTQVQEMLGTGIV